MKFCALAPLLLHAVSAHLPLYEQERQNRPGDYSFDQPFNINQYGLETSLVVENYLRIRNGSADIDVFTYEKRDNKTALFYGFPSLPACEENKDVYPALTLIGPNLEGGRTDEPLPFSLPEGYRSITVRDVPQNASRKIFEFGVGPFKSQWWMPPSYEPSCDGEAVTQPPSESGCSYPHAIRTYQSTPGNYYYVMWGAGGYDTSAILGYKEDVAAIIKAIPTMPLTNRETLHTACTAPIGNYTVVSA